MDKLAMYEAILEDHPLWQEKEAAAVDPEEFNNARTNAAIIGAIPGFVPFSTIGSGALAAEGRGLRTAAGQLAGALGGSYLGNRLGGGSFGANLAGQVAGGGLGAYLAHGDRE